MRHGHIINFPEFFSFFDQYLRGGTPMPVVSRPVVKDGQVMATVDSKTKLISANLHYTTGPHAQNGKRPWKTVSLTVDGQRIYGVAPPKNVTVWYLDVRDERKALVSSEVMLAK
jgi:hypothetical protein